MISEKEYEVLKALKKSPIVYGDLYADELYSLAKQEMISRTCAYPVNSGQRYSKCTVLPKGEAAIEEYKRILKSRKREEDAAKKANTSNVIAITFGIITSLISVAAIIVSVISLLQ